jgi:hypothetical protein
MAAVVSGSAIVRRMPVLAPGSATVRSMPLALPAAVRQPSSWIVMFTAVAFLAWAFGTSSKVDHPVGWSQQWAAVVTAMVAFVLPVLDETLARWRVARRVSPDG